MARERRTCFSRVTLSHILFCIFKREALFLLKRKWVCYFADSLGLRVRDKTSGNGNTPARGAQAVATGVRRSTAVARPGHAGNGRGWCRGPA